MSSPEHPCIDCGKPCSQRALRCKSCDGIHSRKKTPWSFYHPHNCTDCQKPISRGKHLRCHSCAAKHRWITGIPQLSGSNHPMWKGGRVKTVNGYITIYKPDHPRATGGNKKYVLEHIVIWEEANGKPLPKGWIIHHLNGIPDDNRIQNLFAMPRKKHYLVLQAKGKRIQELEALLNGQGQLI